MSTRLPESSESPSALQIDLARRILERVRDSEWRVGTRLSVPELARSFGVSRSPVSAALDLLVDKGIVQPMERRGLCVARDITDENLAELLPESPLEKLYRRIMRERALNQLPQDISEAELMPRYGVSRGVVRKLLMRLAAEGLAQRMPGHGWRFVDSLETDESYRESYEFRIIVECAALRSANFRVSEEKVEQIRRSHERILKNHVLGSGDEWFRVNAAFHEGLAGFSGNRFLVESVRQQNNLRRMHESAAYSELPPDRIRQSCREHLAILEAIEAVDREWAEALLRQHLRQAAEYRLPESS